MHRSRLAAPAAIVLAVALTTLLAGCPSPPQPPPQPPITPTETTNPTSPAATTPVTTEVSPTPAGTVAFRVYFDFREKVQPVYRAVPYTTGVIRAAVTELIKGPTASEKAKGLTCQVPRKTKVRGVSLKNGIATVDLSNAVQEGGGTFSETLRLAELVYTVTQFRGVKGMKLKIDGHPVDVFSGEGIELPPEPLTRADYEDFTPAILLEMPSWGATLRSGDKVSGTSNVFEAQSALQIIGPNGKVVLDRGVTATSGNGTRGTWSTRASFSIPASGWGKVKVFTDSAKDGSEIDVVVVPVYLVR